MFHVKPPPTDPAAEETFDRLERWIGRELAHAQRTQLLRYADWLVDEAAPAGGIGPHEAGRVLDRHIADSLAFAAGFPPGGSGEGSTGDAPIAPRSLVDVGSGVGLPGIPLAIWFPTTEVTLLDRSARRTALARRAVRILGLENVSVVTGEIGDLVERYAVCAFRASLPIPDAAEVFRDLAEPAGLGLAGVSRTAGEPDVPPPPPGVTFELLSDRSTERRDRDPVLDSPVWLLRMRRTPLESIGS